MDAGNRDGKYVKKYKVRGQDSDPLTWVLRIPGFKTCTRAENKLLDKKTKKREKK